MDQQNNSSHVEPANSGVEPKQAKASEAETTALVRVKSPAPYVEYPLSEAVGGISEYGVRGQAATVLLIANVRSLEKDVAAARQEVARLGADNDRLRTDLASSNTNAAVLRERLRAARQLRLARSILNTAGGLVAGISLPALSGQNNGYAVAGSILALLFLGAGWFMPDRRSEDAE